MKRPEEILKEARKKAPLTQSDMADKLGIGLRMYQKIEKGQFPKLKKEQVFKIDEILGTNIYELIYEQNGIRGTLQNVPNGNDTSKPKKKDDITELIASVFDILAKNIAELYKEVDDLRGEKSKKVSSIDIYLELKGKIEKVLYDKIDESS